MDRHYSARNSYFPAIDSLRAIAVLAVLVYHFDNALLPGGFTGVDVFFVISGYVISMSLASGYSSTFLEFILAFYKRRILRILPALLFFLVLASIVSSLFISDQLWSRNSSRTGLAAFFGISNVLLVHRADGYFSQRVAFDPFVHTWSLAVEEQFYLLFPLIFYIWLKARRGECRFCALSLSVLPVAAFVSLAFSYYETREAHLWAFYLLPSRFWELAAGAILFQLQSRNVFVCRTPERASLLLFIGAGSLAIAFLYVDETHFPFPWALLPVLGALLTIVGATGISATPGLLETLAASPGMTYLGRISYSLYLWHWAVFVLFRWTLGLGGVLASIAALMITFALSALSYHLVENPFRRNRFIRRQESWRVLVGGLGVILAAFLATYLLVEYKAPLGLDLSVTQNAYIWRPRYMDVVNGQRHSANTSNEFGRGKKIFVIGDSHAGAYDAMVRLASRSLGAQAIFRSRPGCPIAKLILASKDTEECHDYKKNTVAWVKEHAHAGDIVFLASLRMPRLFRVKEGALDVANVLAHAESASEVQERKLALRQAAEVVDTFRALGLHVLIDAPMPVFKAPPNRCSDWFNKSNPICRPGFQVSRELLMKLREPTMVSLKELQHHHGIHVWDPFPLLCQGPVCSAYDGNKPLFLDGDHLSGYGNRVLVSSFAEELRLIWMDGADKGGGFLESRVSDRPGL